MSGSKKLTELLILSILLFFCTESFADVNQKRFDFKKTGTVKAVEQPQTQAAVDTVSVHPGDVKTTSSYFFIGSDAMWEWLVSSQKTLREKISSQVSRLQNGNSSSLGIFLLVCFIYGIIHAIGPGHGKTIVASYFIARRGKLLQGVGLGTSITFIHTLSAVILLFILYGITQATLFPLFESSRIHIEKASFALIALTGILLIAISIREISCGEHSENAPQNANWKELLWLAFVTGIVPCPAVALVVFFCLLHGMPGIAILGAAAIGLGMAITNTGFGIVSILLRRGIDSGIQKTGKLSRYAYFIHSGLSLCCGVCLSVLGLFLFLNAR